jgi:3-hydroxyisobutyrate dehydrogenase-like beta-hydroxyacid dehydrogenase
MAVTRIGVVGVGSMGLAIARRLQNHGFAVTVCDPDPARSDLATRHRLRLAPSPAETALYSRCTIVAVGTSAEVDEVLFGRASVTDALRVGDCVMLCTNQPAGAVERQSAALVQRGIQCIDAPISGGPDRAAWGTLTILVACDPALFERHRPMIDVLASRVMRVGARVGMASHAAMINNLAAAINLAGMAEAMALASRVGLDAAQMLEIVESSSGQSAIGSERLAHAMRGDPAIHARLGHRVRDLQHAATAAAASGVDAPLTAAAARQYQRASAAGLEAADDSSLFRFVREGTMVEEAPERAQPGPARLTGPDRAPTG